MKQWKQVLTRNWSIKLAIVLLVLMGFGSYQMRLYHKAQNSLKGQKIDTSFVVEKDEKGEIKRSVLTVKLEKGMEFTKQYESSKEPAVELGDFFGDGVQEVLVIFYPTNNTEQWIEAQIFDIDVRNQQLQEIFSVKESDCCKELQTTVVTSSTGKKQMGLKMKLCDEETNEMEETLLVWSEEDGSWKNIL